MNNSLEALSDILVNLGNLVLEFYHRVQTVDPDTDLSSMISFPVPK